MINEFVVASPSHPEAWYESDFFGKGQGAHIRRRTQYVVGLAFSTDRQRVVLIEKTHGPEVLIGKLNGVGGKLEPGEQADAAMVREFKEETGVHHEEWAHFLTLHGKDWTVYFYCTFVDTVVDSVQTTTEERVCVFSLYNAPTIPANIMPNLRWIIPMALSYQDEHVASYSVTEVL